MWERDTEVQRSGVSEGPRGREICRGRSQAAWKVGARSCLRRGQDGKLQVDIVVKLMDASKDYQYHFVRCGLGIYGTLDPSNVLLSGETRPTRCYPCEARQGCCDGWWTSCDGEVGTQTARGG